MTRTRKTLAWAGGIFVLLVAVLVVILATFDWNRIKPTINSKVSEILHRPFAINGDLAVRWQREEDQGPCAESPGKPWQDGRHEQNAHGVHGGVHADHALPNPTLREVEGDEWRGEAIGEAKDRGGADDSGQGQQPGTPEARPGLARRVRDGDLAPPLALSVARPRNQETCLASRRRLHPHMAGGIHLSLG